MDDINQEEKKKIRPKIVIEEGEKVPSIDSLTSTEEVNNSSTDNKQVEENIEEVVSREESKVEDHSETPVFSEPTSTILSEETKGMPINSDVKVVVPPQPIEKKKGKLTFVLITVVIALIVALLAGGIYVYMDGTDSLSDSSDDTALLSSTPSPTSGDVVPTPSPTPAEKIDVSTLKVSILNGSGKIGEAGKVKTIIEQVGFKVANTGNAAAFDFEETVIQAKEGTAQAAIDSLVKALSENYEVKVGDSLKTTNTYDIVITVGSK